jgi:hypothetical protein
MGPFTGIASGSEGAVRKLLYSALALILYGLLALMLADFMRREADSQRRADVAAREAEAARTRRESGTFVSPA